MQVKCAHRKCMCVVPEGKQFCSEWCQSNARDEGPPCGCGHAICEQIYKRNVPRATAPASC